MGAPIVYSVNSYTSNHGYSDASDRYVDGMSKVKYTDTYRRFFGEPELNAEPMISGFGIAFFDDLPDALLGARTNDYVGDYLTAVVTSVDIPDMTYDVISYDGRDGGQWHVPGAIKMGGDISMNMWELRGIPTYSVLSKWIHIMRNPHYGFMSDYAWRQQNYKGKLLYVSCTPDLEVQEAKVYAGIWPTDLKDSVFKYDNNQEKIEISATFKFDHYPYSSIAIKEKGQAMVDSMVDVVRNVVATKYERHADNSAGRTGGGSAETEGTASA